MCYILHAKPPNLHSSPGPCYMCYMCYILHAKPLNIHSPPAPCYMYYMCYIFCTRENLLYMCYIGPYSTYSTYSTYSKEPGESGCSVACLVRYSTYSTYSKDVGDCEGSAAWCLPGIASRPRLPGIGALPSPRQGIPRKKIQGLPPSILLSPQDCLLQSCCRPRIEGNSTRNSTRATPKKWDMPVSSSELHAGSNQKMVGACFQFRGTSKAQVPLALSSITFLPGIEASPAAPPARRRSPAEPAPRSGFFPGKNVEVVV